jgi:hypothetical protein
LRVPAINTTIAKGERSVMEETVAAVFAGLGQEMSALERRRVGSAGPA